jgi:hypothetical protein
VTGGYYTDNQEPRSVCKNILIGHSAKDFYTYTADGRKDCNASTMCQGGGHLYYVSTVVCCGNKFSVILLVFLNAFIFVNYSVTYQCFGVCVYK